MIQVENLSKSYGKVQALKNVSFTAPDGLVTGVLGPNGAGKTTTLRILYTVLKPDSGSAFIDGYDLQKEPEAARRHIGVLPDSRGLYPRLTARENIRYYGRLHELDEETLYRSTDRLVNLLGMNEIADRPARGFSTGETLKVAIARALVHDPQNIIFDEPTNGLDVMSTRAMRDFICRMRDQGKCVLFSSHIMQEVSALCDNIVILAKGKIVICGSPDEIRLAMDKESLEDAFVAAIGTEEGLG